MDHPQNLEQLFNHYLIFSSIILGLGVAKLLQGIGKLIKYHKHCWVLDFWIAFLFLLQIQYWWAEYIDRNMVPSNFFLNLINISFPVGLFLMSEILIPDPESQDFNNIEKYYFDNKFRIFGLGIFMAFLAMIRAYVVLKRPYFESDTWIRITFIVLFLVLLVENRQIGKGKTIIHIIGGGLSFGLLIMFIFMYTLNFK